MVNGRSAVEWIMERYQIKTDKASGITNDPNRLGHRAGQAEVHPRLAPERDNRQRGNSEDRERAAGG